MRPAHYAHEGAELVLLPHAWDSDALDEEGRVINYDSMERFVVDPSGRVVAETRGGGEQLVCATV